MTESLEELIERLDKQFHGINRGRGVHVLRDEWPRISRALREMRRGLVEHQCIDCEDLLANLDKGDL